MSITIIFLLPNQQQITKKSFHQSIQLNQIFDDIHYTFDFFDQEPFHLEWSIYSITTNRYFGYESTTLQEILQHQQEDTFIFVDSMITGLKLSNWFNRASNLQITIQNFTDEQIHELKNNLLEGCVSLTCENYLNSIEQYLKALEIDLLNEDSMLGIGGCLINLNCFTSAIQIFDFSIKINPKNSLAHMNKGKALNRNGQPDLALKSLETAISLNPQLSSVYDQEKSIANSKLQMQKNDNSKQNLQQEI